jgi:hypothetical protein
LPPRVTFSAHAALPQSTTNAMTQAIILFIL